jgi:hypothetical protein
MLSGLAVSAAATALLAGIAGAWSPCGFSMVDTIGTALGDARRSATTMAATTFTAGAMAGGALTFGTLAFLGGLVGHEASGVRGGLAALIALAAALADWRGVTVAPQIRRQVPERWRWTMPLSLACGLYGILLGLGFTTFVLTFAVWALAGISFAAGSPAVGLLIGVAFGVGRALPILWMAPALRGGGGARRLDSMASEPRLWLGLRRLDALGLGLCALFIGTTSALANGGAGGVLPNATDPSAAGGDLVWQPTSGPAMLRLTGGTARALPGEHAALGQSSIAWQVESQIAVADVTSMAVRLTIPLAGVVDALAVSDDWVVYREPAGTGEQLLAVALFAPSRPPAVLEAGPAGEIGRPALDGSTVVFTMDTPSANAILAVNLDSGARRVLRSSARGEALLNPALLSGRLLYERIDRCAQELDLGSPSTPREDRLLLRLPSTVQRDPGYQPGYEHAYNGASVCANRPGRRGGTIRLGATALSSSAAYVTEIPSSYSRARIVTFAR